MESFTWNVYYAYHFFPAASVMRIPEFLRTFFLFFNNFFFPWKSNNCLIDTLNCFLMPLYSKLKIRVSQLKRVYFHWKGEWWKAIFKRREAFSSETEQREEMIDLRNRKSCFLHPHFFLHIHTISTMKSFYMTKIKLRGWIISFFYTRQNVALSRWKPNNE